METSRDEVCMFDRMESGTRGIGGRGKWRDRGPSRTRMGRSMWGTSRLTRNMGMECSYGMMVSLGLCLGKRYEGN